MDFIRSMDFVGLIVLNIYKLNAANFCLKKNKSEVISFVVYVYSLKQPFFSFHCINIYKVYS